MSSRQRRPAASLIKLLTAELTKTNESVYRDVNIAFADEMALVCESLGVDVYEVRPHSTIVLQCHFIRS